MTVAKGLMSYNTVISKAVKCTNAPIAVRCILLALLMAEAESNWHISQNDDVKPTLSDSWLRENKTKNHFNVFDMEAVAVQLTSHRK